MNYRSASLPALLFVAALCCRCSSTGPNTYRLTRHYTPDDRALYDTIVHLDSVFFGAYNSCDQNFDRYASFYADSIEFYHDGGGLSTSRQEVLESTKKYVCGKVSRELVKGSIEVYPIKGWGAVEMGLHRFHNRVEGSTGRIGRFVVLWRRQSDGWKITRVVSLH